MTDYPLKKIRFRLEAWLVRGTLAVLRQLPFAFSSWLGGVVLGLVGPFLPPHKTARRNLERAFPEKSDPEISRILSGMWNNLGRTAGEYPHLNKLITEEPTRVEVSPMERLTELSGADRPVIFISAHIANWEVMPIAAARYGVYASSVFRRPNNPYLAKVFEDRVPHPEMGLIPKGPSAGRALLKLLRQNKAAAILIDQKLREGIPVRFFGRDAMTPSAFAEFALKLGCDVVPIQLERLAGTQFRMTIHPALEAPESGSHEEKVAALTQNATSLLEEWVRARPEQWFWVHRRWPD